MKHWSQHVDVQLAFACVYELKSWVNCLIAQSAGGRLESSKALCAVAAHGDPQYLTALIQAGADVDYEEDGFGSPLYLALTHNRPDIMETLIYRRAMVSKGLRRCSPLVAAIEHCPAQVVRSLLEHGADVTEHVARGQLRSMPICSSGLHAVEAAVPRGSEVLAVVLKAAEYQNAPAEFYKVALLSSQAFTRYDDTVRLEIARLFPRLQPIHLRIRRLVDSCDPYIKVGVWADTSCAILKKIMEHRSELWADGAMLVHNLRVIKDHRTVTDYGMTTGSTIHVILKARWGGLSWPGG